MRLTAASRPIGCAPKWLAALVADGLHARTDGFTSLTVVVGAAGVAAGLPCADPVVGLLIAVAILGVLRSAAIQVGARLMDAVDPDMVHAARDAVATVDGILDVRDLRLRWIGHTLHADADVTVHADLPVVKGHDIAHHAEQHLLKRLRDCPPQSSMSAPPDPIPTVTERLTDKGPCRDPLLRVPGAGPRSKPNASAAGRACCVSAWSGARGRHARWSRDLP
jgi:hypothetical protein